MKYRKANEIQHTQVPAQWKVQFAGKTDDIKEIDDKEAQPFIHEFKMVNTQKSTRKKLFGNVKDALGAYEKSAKERPSSPCDATVNKR